MKKIYNHCCQQMRNTISQGDLTLKYVPKYREYGIMHQNGGSYQMIDFCPWCGEKLPASLRNEWFVRLDDLGFEPEDCIPENMKSDAWWLDN